MANVNNMKMGSSGLAALKVAEGYNATLYNDGNTKKEGHCTIGYGHLVHYDICNSKKHPSEKPFINGIKKKNAISILKKDFASAEKAVNKYVTVKLTQNQFDALVIFAFNVGIGGFKNSTALKELNNQNYNKVPSQLKRWNKSRGKVMQGLINRRNKEIQIWNKK